ncbi:MAG: TonB-dependent receptor plug domain-containing protein [Campylobacter sp.]|nr:TonB-dependent receptor plug domain-containing protein [Campylobacter sp.]
MKKIVLISFVYACAFGDQIVIKDLNVTANKAKGGGAIKTGEFLGSTSYDRDYLNSSLKGDGVISNIIKANPNARVSLGERTSKNSGEILPQNISINGAEIYQNNFLVDGVNINNDINPLGGVISTGAAANRTPFLTNPSQGLNIDTDLLENIEILDSSVSAKYGSFQGGVVRAKTKDPRRGFHGKINFSYTSDDWQKFHIAKEEQDDFDYSTNSSYQPDFKKYKTGVTLEGFLSDNFGLIMNYNQTYSKIYQQIYQKDYDLEPSLVGSKRKLYRKNENLFLKGLWYANDSLTVRPSFTYSPYKATYYSTGGHNAGAKVEGGAIGGSVEFDYDTSFANINQIFSYQESQMSRDTNSDRMFVWRKTKSMPGVTKSKTDNVIDGVGGDVDQKQSKFAYSLDVEFNEFDLGITSHSFIAGLHLDKTDAKYDIKNPYYHATTPLNLGIFSCKKDDIFCLDDEIIANRYQNWSGQYFNRYNYYQGKIDVDMKTYAFYLEDKIKIDRFTIRPGFRLDKNDYMGNLNYSPRLSVNADVFNDDKTNIFGGYNRYYGRSIFAYKLRDGMSALESSYKRKNPNSPWEYDKSALNSYNFKDLDVPYDDEYVVGFAQKFGDFELSGKYTRREGKDLIRRTSASKMGATPGDGKTLRKDYYYYTNEGESKTNIYTLKLKNLNQLEAFGTYNSFEISYNYIDTKRNFDNFNDIFDDYYDKATKVVYKDKVINQTELPKNTNDIPWKVTATTITKIPSMHFTWSNFFTLQGGYDAIVRDGKVDIDGKRLTKYKDKSIDNSFTWDTRLSLEFPLPKESFAFINFDIYNILDDENAVSISDNGVVNYDVGRQFWLEVGYRW